MSMTEAYVKWVGAIPLNHLEDFSNQWLNMQHPDKGIILCSLIDAKLRIYEEEY